MTPKCLRLAAAFALAAALLTIGSSIASAASDYALRVMSFNIRTSSARDGENVWPNRRDLFFGDIERFNPALIGFQEVRADQHDEILERMKGYQFVGVARDDGKRKGEWSLVGFRSDRFEKLTHGDFWLSETPEVVASKSWDAALTRLCTWARLKDRLTGQEILFANTHFDHQGIVSREKSARLLVLRLTELAEGKPIVLTGDFNFTEDTPGYAVITRPQGDAAAWLVDSYRALHPQRQPDEASFHAFKGTTAGSRIDFIFHSRTFKTVEAKIVQTGATNGRYPSDHYAVTAVLDYPPATPINLKTSTR